MIKRDNISSEMINNLSYPDFVGLINQWNTPPGAYSTLSKLAVFSNMTKNSRILDVGCSTGFSSRELAVLTNCSGIGFDLSRNSVKMAKYNKEKYAPQINIDYRIADGYTFKAAQKFTHIVTGGNLKFFPDPGRMLDRCLSMLDDEGFILATPYYEVSPMPVDLINRTHKTLGIPLDAFSNFSYKEVMRLYNKLEIVYEDRNTLIQETDEELKYYCKSIIDLACKMNNIGKQEVYDEMLSRLLMIRRLINESRPYQRYCVLVLRYRKEIFPRRLTALF